MNNISDLLLSARGITKQFPGVKALDNVDFDLRSGEVHILVGENGAGKSTLAKVFLGAYIADEGEIYINGNQVVFNTAKDGLGQGIAAVYQEFTLVPYLTVAQNIFLNREPVNKLGLIDNKKMEEDSVAILRLLNCDYINVKTYTKNLSVAEQQMVEIAKALSYNPKIMVFDEPTAPLSEKEVHSLFEQIIRLKNLGIGIVYVSHRMQEFGIIGDRITILRDGKKIKTINVGSVSDNELVNMMVGRDISQVYQRTRNQFTGEVLRVNNVSTKSGRVRNASLQLNRGEIVGLAGLVGSGRTELAKIIFGIDPTNSGEIYINGNLMQKLSPVITVGCGVGMVSEDRKRYGLALKQSVSTNIMTVSIKKYFPKWFINQNKISSIANEYIDKLRIATPDVFRLCKYLSGGNQQKVVLSKWLSADVEILLFDEPTRGIDVGAKMEIYALMDAYASQGKSVLMISSDLPEIIGMSDRIYVMRNGMVVDEYLRKDFDVEKIGASMLGVTY